MRAIIKKDYCLFEQKGLFFKVGFSPYFYCVLLHSKSEDYPTNFQADEKSGNKAIEFLLEKMNELLKKDYTEFMNNFTVRVNGNVSITFKNGRLRFIISDVFQDYLFVNASVPGFIEFGNFIVRNVFDVDKLRLLLRAEEI